MFQPFLDIGRRALRIYAVLEPTRRMNDPWTVHCIACPFTATAPNHRAAVRLAAAHDRTHDNQEGNR